MLYRTLKDWAFKWLRSSMYRQYSLPLDGKTRFADYEYLWAWKTFKFFQRLSSTAADNYNHWEPSRDIDREPDMIVLMPGGSRQRSTKYEKLYNKYKESDAQD